MRKSNPPLLIKAAICLAALAVLTAGADAWAAGHASQTRALSAPACGAAAGGLADPADTQRCLAERYKPPKPRPDRTSAPAASPNAASAAPTTAERAAASGPPPAASQGD